MRGIDKGAEEKSGNSENETKIGALEEDGTWYALLLSHAD